MDDDNCSQYESRCNTDEHLTDEIDAASENEKQSSEANDEKIHQDEDLNVVPDDMKSALDASSANEYTDEEYLELYQKSCLGKSCSSQGWIQKIRSFCCKLPGYYYCIVHMIFMLLIGIIIFFVTNKSYLCMTLFVISLDAFANVVFFDCPLSSLEKKYLNTSLIDSRLKSIQNYGMMYANNKIYDTQLEVIINGWTLCAGKILLLIVFDWLKISY